jgi:hypothetical protein
MELLNWFLRKAPTFFRRKLAKIAENGGHNNDRPCEKHFVFQIFQVSNMTQFSWSKVELKKMEHAVYF